ncbi:MAG: diphosphate--fructose-6-phosphate 1-phosphotransferase, partial [Lentisphaeria bacterium]|nr:diphosphate--fructose-6-phosphate 1-phosphotransferase [Lentisphaeria bacterium]
MISALQKARAAYQPKLPVALRNGAVVKVCEGGPTTAVADVEKIQALFSSTFGSPVLTFEAGNGGSAAP